MIQGSAMAHTSAPAPSHAPVGTDADEMLRAAREKSDAELDTLRLKFVGLG
jgi:hypothetical protein